MSTRRTYTSSERETALALYETDGPTAVQDTLGIPKSTVRKWARLAGRHTTVTTRTAAATQAAAASAAQSRAHTADGAISAAQTALSTIQRRLETEADTMPIRELAVVFGILVDKHVMLARLDHASEDYSAVDAWLNHIMDGTPART